MLSGWPREGIWLWQGAVDMRNSFDGLSGLVYSQFGSDPRADRWHVFVNRRRTLVKVLGCDHGGFWIWSKRLERGSFQVCDLGRGVELTQTELMALLEGIEIVSHRRRVRYRLAA